MTEMFVLSEKTDIIHLSHKTHITKEKKELCERDYLQQKVVNLEKKLSSFSRINVMRIAMME